MDYYGKYGKFKIRNKNYSNRKRDWLKEFLDLAISADGKKDIITGSLKISPELSILLEEDSTKRKKFYDAAVSTIKRVYPYEGVYLAYNNISTKRPIHAEWKIEFVVFPWVLYGHPHNKKFYYADILDSWKYYLDKFGIISYNSSNDHMEIELGRISAYHIDYRERIEAYIDELVKEPIERLDLDDLTQQEIDIAIDLVDAIPIGFNMFRLLGMISRRMIGIIREDYGNKNRDE